VEKLIDRAARDLITANYAIALTGAGMSTESGIPDFRGPTGVWTKNPEEEEKAYRSYQVFLDDPKGWWRGMLAGRSLLGDLAGAQPNQGHYALTELEELNIIKCLITQNIDALHEKAGMRKILEYHGSVLKLRCHACGLRFRREDFDLERLAREDRLPPRCPECHGAIKSDTVFFGEPIPPDVAYQSLEEAYKCDLMLVCGTSAVVFPFANLPRIARERRDVTIIELNAEPTPLTTEGISDYLIQGKTGEILPPLAARVKELLNSQPERL